MSSQEPPKSRTQMFAAIKPPPTRSTTVAFYASCGVLVAFLFGFTSLCAGLELFVNFAVDPMIAVLSVVMAVVFAVPYMGVLLWVDRNDPEPPHLIASAFLWGAILATGLSGLFNSLVGAVLEAFLHPALAQQLTASFSAPFIEELTKAAALYTLFVFFHRDFDNVVDGVLYGAYVGLGFAVFENFVYYFSHSEGTVGGVLYITVLRGVLAAVGSHPCFTAFSGLGLGLYRVMRSGPLRYLMPPLGLAVAMFAHFVWNTFIMFFAAFASNDAQLLLISVPLAVIFLQLPFVVMVLGVMFVAIRHENQLISTYLANEKPPVLLGGELARLVPARRRTVHLVSLVLAGQLGALLVTIKRNRRLIRLAFEKWHMDEEAESGTALQARGHAVAVQDLRKQLTALQLPG